MNFTKSFSSLDRRFFIVWLLDVLFYATIGVVFYASLFRFGSISQEILDLQQLPATQQIVDQLYAQAYVYVVTIAVCAIVVYLAYVLFQSLQWSTILNQRLTLKLIGTFALYGLLAWFFGVLTLAPFVAMLIAVWIAGAQAAGAPVVVLGYIIALVFYSLVMPFTIFPSYAFFKERRVWNGIAKMYYLGLSTIPRLWKQYLLGGAVMLLVTQLYYVLVAFDVDPSLGGFILLMLLVSPVLAWYRFYIVGLLEQH